MLDAIIFTPDFELSGIVKGTYRVLRDAAPGKLYCHHGIAEAGLEVLTAKTIVELVFRLPDTLGLKDCTPVMETKTLVIRVRFRFLHTAPLKRLRRRLFRR